MTVTGLNDEQIKWVTTLLEVPEAALRAGAALIGEVVPGVGEALAAPAKAAGIDPGIQKQMDQLAEMTNHELGELTAQIGELDQKFNGKMIAEYLELRQQLGSFLDMRTDSQNGTANPSKADLAAWSETLSKVGELRKILTSNRLVDLDKDIRFSQANLEALSNDLARLKASAKRIEDAVEQVEDGEKWVGRMLKLNDAMEMLEGSVKAMHEAGTELIKEGAWAEGKIAAYAGLVKEGYVIATTSTVIEQGVKNLAEYNITLAIAGEGFSSVHELEQAIESKAEQIHEANEKLQRLAANKKRNEEKYAHAGAAGPS